MMQSLPGWIVFLGDRAVCRWTSVDGTHTGGEDIEEKKRVEERKCKWKWQ